MDAAMTWDGAIAAAMSWIDLKSAIKRFVGYRSDALHVVTGLAILFGVALLFRKTVADWLPLIMLLVLAALNEAVDILIGGSAQYVESTKDMLVTMVVPVIILITVRRLPYLYDRSAIPARSSRHR